MKILVSACVMGQNCKYNGKNNKNVIVQNYLKDKDIIVMCPEMLAKMPIPRPCAELVSGSVWDENGNCVDAVYIKAVKTALHELEDAKIELAVLQSRSPTCGAKEIYDGTFTGRLIPGYGLFAKALIEKGYKVVDVEDFAAWVIENSKK